MGKPARVIQTGTMTTNTNETTQPEQKKAKKPPTHVGYFVREHNGKKYWNRRGAAWLSEDGKRIFVQMDDGASFTFLPPKQKEQPEGAEAEGAGA
jgi:hypothetical protein